MSNKLTSGGTLPAITLPLVGGGEHTIGQVADPNNWAIVIVYRGLHCPICHEYLKRLEQLKRDFTKVGSEIVAISGDPQAKAETMVETGDLTFPVGYGLSIEQMQVLGLYISNPRSEHETDQPFPEPATFVVNTDAKLQLIDISNTPFNRADLKELVETVEWIRDNNYPIRGTYPD
ncbi:MAG: peroxiredoxin-like family protein [Verrucomicrobiota bacterium]